MEIRRHRGSAPKDPTGNMAAASPANDSWLFAQALLGNSVRLRSAAMPDETAQHELREWLDEISPVLERFWDPAKHPRGAFAQNRGWFSPTSGTGSAARLLAGPEAASREPDRLSGSTRQFSTVSDKAPKPAGPSEPSTAKKSRATSKIDSRTKAKIWSGQYGGAIGSPSTVGFKVVTTGMSVTAAQEQAIADAVVEAIDTFSEVADIIRNRRSQLKSYFANKKLLVGTMAHDDSIYATMLANLDRVMNGIRGGSLILEADVKYTSANEPLLYTMMNPFTYNARSEMRFGARFVSAPHAEKVRTLMHEFGRRWGRQYQNELDPQWGVGAWDGYIDRIFRERDVIRKAK